MRKPHLALLAAATAAILGAPLVPGAATAAPPSDSAVTDDGSYTRHDGGLDQAIRHCGNGASSPAADGDLDDADVDSNDGGNQRQANEPTVAIDPTNPDVMAAGWNDYCQSDLGAGWMGIGFSTDRGETWTDSTIPGYPLDDSAEGSQSPLKGRTDAGDPLVAFDNDGRLFFGGIAFNRASPQNGSVYVGTYGADAGPSGPSGQLPKDYLRTRIVGKAGTPAVNGIFQDKPMLEVDRSTASPYEDNVYFCWTKFQGLGGRSKIYFARSTDHGVTFEKTHQISDGYVQGCDIAVEHDGDAYVSWRSYGANGKRVNGMRMARSTDGGQTFAKPQQIASFTPYAPNQAGQRDCGDGPFYCGDPGYVFHRVPLEPRITADQTGEVDGVFATWNAVDPKSVVESRSPYYSAGPGLVGRSLVYVAKSTDDGSHWSDGQPVDPSPSDPGHQYFPDVDAYDGMLVAMWQDNRTDNAYSRQLPLGNRIDASGRAVSSGTDVTGTYASVSDDGVNWTPVGMVSATTHQPQYEMFGARDIPFQGDYNWVAIADGNGSAAGGLFAYMVWTDNREVVEGIDPRETEAENGFVDGFDVAQCLVDLGRAASDVNEDIPLARAEAPYTGNNCSNAGGVDQDIYGASIALS